MIKLNLHSDTLSCLKASIRLNTAHANLKSASIRAGKRFISNLKPTPYATGRCGTAARYGIHQTNKYELTTAFPNHNMSTSCSERSQMDVPGAEKSYGINPHTKELMKVILTDKEREICAALNKFAEYSKEKEPVQLRIAGGWVRDKVNLYHIFLFRDT